MRPGKSIREGFVVSIAFLIAGLPLWPAAQNQQGSLPAYTLDEKSYKAAHQERNPQKKLKLLDAFVLKYPETSLAQYVYQDYYRAYDSVKNYPRAIAYADKLLAMDAPIDTGSRLEALDVRAHAYLAWVSCDPSFQTREFAATARDAATKGLQELGQWQKPSNMSNEQFAASQNNFAAEFNAAAAMADLSLKGTNPPASFCKAK